MDKITDEILMAYADEALPPSEMRRIAAIVARDPDLAARLMPFAVTRTALPQIFSDAQLGPIPSRLLDTVMTAPIGASKRQSKSAGLFGGLRDFLFPETLTFGRSLALCGTVLAFVGAGWMASRAVLQKHPSAQQLIAVEDGKKLARGALAQALETAQMLQTVASPDGQTATPVLTFKNAQGRICRQFEAAQSDSDAVAGYACRDDVGQWQVGFHGKVQNPAHDNNAAGITPASGQSNPGLDAAIDSVISGDVLGVESERALIANGWKVDAADKVE